MNIRFFALLMWLACGLARAQSYTTFTFDSPTGMTLLNLRGMNSTGQILGWYNDSSQKFHSMLRSADGATYTEIAVPGATQTYGYGLNNLGETVGYYTDALGSHSFIRRAAGNYETFDIPPEGGVATQAPIPTAMNDKGDLAGMAYIAGSVQSGFMLSADRKTYTPIHICTLTAVDAINNAGDLAGTCRYGTSYGLKHGFVRKADGTVRLIDAPGVLTETTVSAINNRGDLSAAGMVLHPDGSTALPDPTLSGPIMALDDNGRVAGCSGFAVVPCRGFLGVPSTGTQPVIRPWRGVISASAFGGSTTIAPGSWIEIYGSNLSKTTRAWQASDFVGSTAPTSLDGVNVLVNGRRAVVSYISPGQVNALVPETVTPGPAQVIVSNDAGTSRGFSATVAAVAPGVLAISQDVASTWAMAVFPDFQTFVLPQIAYPTLPPTPTLSTRAAKAGEIVVLYGIGFGATTPEILIGGLPAQVTYAGPAPDTLGLYQFNVVVPSGLLVSGARLEIRVNGVAIDQTKLYLAVQP